RIAKRPLPSLISPIAIPATVDFIFIPASIKARLPAHTVAIELEPLDSRISDTTRMVYGFSDSGGSALVSARKARFPCPTSRLPVPRMGRTSPVEKGGKL